MIDILRRLRRFMISESKFSTYLLYAAGEIVLIVIGILLALEIDNWNESKKNESDINSLLVLIKDNLREDIIELESNLSMGKKFLNHLRSVQIENPSSNGQTNLINHLGVYDFNSNNSGYLSSIRSNKISLISNRKLVNEITTYYELRFREMENRSAAFNRQTLILTNKIFDSLSRSEGIKNMSKRTQLLIDDPVFKETLGELVGTTDHLLAKIGERINDGNALIRSISKELNNY